MSQPALSTASKSSVASSPGSAAFEIQVGNLHLTPVLSDEWSRPLETVSVFAAAIDPKQTSGVIKLLGRDYPMETFNLLHLKRVRLKLFLHFLKLSMKANSSNIFSRMKSRLPRIYYLFRSTNLWLPSNFPNG
ncbi:hypothetical protein HK096_004937, partial [Nowakowskiella sp. JEL0078]